ncbi:unnamed protein product [Durusdinium trenchii]|uniref:SGNH hydrolase-type esterase domain-containing protein n=1 Tax=Durusdinium trenchii TaxID=1381693 RepID=A0ABP0KJL7_9DINO
MELERRRYGLLGDSSLYTKRGNNKRTHIKPDLQLLLHEEIDVIVCPGGGVKEFILHLTCWGSYEVLGISYFGNEHTGVPMDEQHHGQMWARCFELLREKADYVVFFMGGFAAKYGYFQPYDDNMSKIRNWAYDQGFEVRTDFDQVQSWPLSHDNLHFSREVHEELVSYWASLLQSRVRSRPSRPSRCASMPPAAMRVPCEVRPLHPPVAAKPAPVRMVPPVRPVAAVPLVPLEPSATVDPSLPLPPWEPQLPVAQRTAEASVTPYKRNKISQAFNPEPPWEQKAFNPEPPWERQDGRTRGSASAQPDATAPSGPGLSTAASPATSSSKNPTLEAGAAVSPLCPVLVRVSWHFQLMDNTYNIL